MESKKTLEWQEKLIEAGARLDEPDDQRGSSALTWASLKGASKGVKGLLEAGASPEGIEGESPTPLMAAIHAGSEEVVEMLLRAGADPSRTTEAVSPLMSALGRNQMRMAKNLLEAGADARAQNETGATALHWAIRKKAPNELIERIARRSDLRARETRQWGDELTAMDEAFEVGATQIGLMLARMGAPMKGEEGAPQTLMWALGCEDLSEKEAAELVDLRGPLAAEDFMEAAKAMRDLAEKGNAQGLSRALRWVEASLGEISAAMAAALCLGKSGELDEEVARVLEPRVRATVEKEQLNGQARGAPKAGRARRGL